MATDAKLAETESAIRAGAHEVDMVINVGALKGGDYDAVQREIASLAAACHAGGAILKVIIETALLTDHLKRVACELSKNAGADFVKSSTGFSTAGATAEDVALMRAAVGSELGVKASGGIRTLDDFERMVAAGASRVGASASVAIVEAAAVSAQGS
jgi:deoxyribose-phosphate aldolase